VVKLELLFFLPGGKEGDRNECRSSSVFFHQGVEFFVKSCYKIIVMKEFNQ